MVSNISSEHHLTQISGWGQAPWSETNLVQKEYWDFSKRAIWRGCGRSYGDAAYLSGGTTLQGMGGKEIQLDVDNGLATVGASVTLGDLARYCIPRGWFLPVTPGTQYVTVGGAIAADIHGKNHHREGSFGNHLDSFQLVTPLGNFNCAEDVNETLFWATIGGMGLTGIITRANLRMKRIQSNLLATKTIKVDNFVELVQTLTLEEQSYNYSVAWVDTLARKKSMGRGLISLANHCDKKINKNTETIKSSFINAPRIFPNTLLNKHTVKLFNSFWFSKNIHKEHESYERFTSFFYPLDMIGNWNNIYGPRGFLQYQFVVPEKSISFLEHCLNLLSSKQIPVFLAVLKKFGPGNPGWLSFPSAGWTLAVDIPTDVEGLQRILLDLDDELLSCGGKIYLAKDSRMRQETFEIMYPNAGNFRSLRHSHRLDKCVASDLSIRLDL